MKDIRPGASRADLDSLINVGGTLYFRANDGTSGIELWKSDGTDAGTNLVADIKPGSASSSPAFLANVGGVLYFQANDGVTGYELWKSNSAAVGTVLVKDFDPGAASSFPNQMTLIGNRLFVVATTVEIGAEVWTADLTPMTAGDYDRDGDADGNDFLRWQQQLGFLAVPPGSGADGNASGLVEAGDLTVWRNNFSGGGSGATQAAAGSSIDRARDAVFAASYAASLSANIPPFHTRGFRPARRTPVAR